MNKLKLIMNHFFLDEGQRDFYQKYMCLIFFSKDFNVFLNVYSCKRSSGTTIVKTNSELKKQLKIIP